MLPAGFTKYLLILFLTPTSADSFAVESVSSDVAVSAITRSSRLSALS